VTVYGIDIAALGWRKLLTFRRRLGYLQVGDGLLQNLSLKANISLPLQYASDHRQSAVDERVGELLERFKLEEIATLRPAAANEEVRRRAAVARAIALDPELLILESPFDGLTHRAAPELMEEVSHTREGTPRTVFITAQDLGPHVIPMMTRIVHVADGLAVAGLE
jgi:ABC-type transporter Mla maintaining outer membrane lipid asymmetry ATPase subunit MlaF